jgi:hypothetical protein
MERPTRTSAKIVPQQGKQYRIHLKRYHTYWDGVAKVGFLCHILKVEGHLNFGPCLEVAIFFRDQFQSYGMS